MRSEEPTAGPAAGPFPGASGGSSDHPTRIGAYEILGVLGEGGMGVVYLAEQHEPVRRQVALKILKLGMDTRQVVARFESERQALAVMEHPSIAKVFDAGATETGRPFFVMERVDGVPITEYCDAQRLAVRDRIKLFAQVCRAVQHAHQKGVIHRDLKPSNVLVTVSGGEPLCKIIDFGIAKATEQSADERTQLTQAGQALGTPAYMSPEQLEGGGIDVDTRADIYSLGVLLYELIAGALPFDPAAYRSWTFYAQLVGGDLKRPSDRFNTLDDAEAVAAHRHTDPASLRKQLRGDLDWIVMRAVERDRSRRYETANGLTLDLERYLSNEPVSAGPPSTSYRARKFVRRHRASVAFATTLVVLLIGFAGTVTVQAARIAAARNVAQARQAQAEDLIGFMVGDLRTKLTPIGKLDVLDDVGNKALEYFAAVPESELSGGEVNRRVEALMQIGQVRYDQDDRDAAMLSFRKALALAQGLVARDSTNAQWLFGLGQAEYWVGFVHIKRLQPDSAIAHFEAYRRISERLVEAHPDTLKFHAEVAYAHGNIGAVLEADEKLDAAAREYSAVTPVWRELVRREPDNPEWQRALAVNLNKRGLVQRKLGNLRGAVEMHRAEVEAHHALFARDSTNAGWLRLHATAHNFLSETLTLTGETRETYEHRLEALRINEALAARDPANVNYQRGLALSARYVGLSLAERGETAAARARYQQSRQIIQRLLADDPTNMDWPRELATGLTAEAALVRHSNPAAAAELATEALAALDPALRAKPTDGNLLRARADALLELGRAYAASGRAVAARRPWQQAVATIEGPAKEGANASRLAVWAAALLELRRTEDARPVIRSLKQQGYHTADLASLARRSGLSF